MSTTIGFVIKSFQGEFLGSDLRWQVAPVGHAFVHTRESVGGILALMFDYAAERRPAWIYGATSSLGQTVLHDPPRKITLRM